MYHQPYCPTINLIIIIIIINSAIIEKCSMHFFFYHYHQYMIIIIIIIIISFDVKQADQRQTVYAGKAIKYKVVII